MAFLSLAAPMIAKAQGIVDITPDATVFDLTTHGTRVAAQRRNLQLEVPGEADGVRAVLELRGTGAGPEFNWTVYTIRNAGPEKRDLVLAVDAQRLTASGLIQLREFGSQLSSAQWLSSSVEHKAQASNSADAFRFELAAGQSITVGLEGRAILSGARLYDVSVFVQREASLAFLRGAALAVCFVLALTTLSLYGIRTHRAFLVAGAFAFAVLLFAALESGYLDLQDLKFGSFIYTAQHTRALVESMLALAIGLLFWGTKNLNRRSMSNNLPFFLLLAALSFLIVYSTWQPVMATRLARGAIISLSVAGFVFAVIARRRAAEIMDNAILFWSGLLAWSFVFIAAALSDSQHPVWHAAVLAGLTAVLSLLAFVCLRLAFAQGFLSKPYLQDSSRRSLALTGAQHYLWDWQSQDGTLDVGVELARSLGHPTERLSSTGALRWFASLLHPADELAYRKSLDLRGLLPGSFVEQELRLRDADGNFHWFALRARALPGAGGIPARLIGTLTDITRNKQAEDRLINESIHDPVTGLPTRALFLDRMEREISKPLALPHRVLMIAIERFKILNEGLGHDLGDQLLLAAGQRIARMLRPEESVARVAGSRFAVMHVESIDGLTAEDLADDIIAALAQPLKVLAQDIPLSACIGISLSSEHEKSAAVLQQQAETALHEAQQQGPRTALVFHDNIEDLRADDVALESELRRAIDRREIEVQYQPIVHLLSREVAGLEALARWRHPVRGLLAPSEFIGMAEQAGLIREVGDIVLAEAIRQMGIWQRVLTRNRPVFMAINVSADQLSDTGFLDRVNMIVTREGVLPHAVKIEITESVVMRFPERAQQLIHRLRSLGMGVACDDFGTGYSNLASLRELPFDTLKMDRSFLSGDGLQGRGILILQSVISMAHSLGMEVVAEGIESEEQAQRLLALGCELGQGYALGHPMAARDVHALLAVLPVMIPVAPKSFAPVLTPPVGLAPMAPRTAVMTLEGDDEEEEEPEELPSIFRVLQPPEPQVHTPPTRSPKPKPVPVKSKPKAKPKPKQKPRKPATKPKKSGKRR